MKEKPVFPLLMSLALPMVISMLVNALYNIVDSLFIARISEDAFTALSLVFPVQNLINSIAIGFGVGINAMIALHLGAGSQEQADRAATQGLVISLLHGLVLTAVSIPLMPAYLRLFTDNAAIVALGGTYAGIVFSFSTVLMASLAVEKILQSVGRMKLTMAGLMLGAVVNLVLDPILIFGWGPLPALGIAGAALATGIGQTTTVVMYLLVCPRMQLPVHLRRRYLRPQNGGAQPQRDLKDFFDPLAFSRAVIVADQGAHPLHNAVGGHIQKGLQFVIYAQHNNIALRISRQQPVQKRYQQRRQRQI